VMIWRSTLSSGRPFFRMRSAFVRCSFSVTASCRNFPMSRFFSLTSFSNGKARSKSFCVASADALAAFDASSAAWTCFRSSLICDSYVSTDFLSSDLRTVGCEHSSKSICKATHGSALLAVPSEVLQQPDCFGLCPLRLARTRL